MLHAPPGSPNSAGLWEPGREGVGGGCGGARAGGGGVTEGGGEAGGMEGKA